MDAKIRVAYVIDTIEEPLGGTEKQLLQILERLDRGRFEPWLFCLRSSRWLEENQAKAATVILDYRGFVKPSFPSVLEKFRGVLEAQRIDVVQTYFEDSFFVAAMACGRMKKPPARIASRRDVGMGPHHLWYHRIFDWVRPYFVKSFDGVMVNAREVGNYIARKDRIPEGKIKVVYNGVDLTVPENSTPGIIAATKADVWIALAANLKKIKRHDVFLNALAKVRQTSTLDVKAVFLGEGSDRKWIEDRIRRLKLEKAVFLLGSVKDVKMVLKAADIGVLSSDKEGLSNAVLEYMACSLPVVATRVGGNAELVDSENGFLVPPDHPDEMAQALGRLVEDKDLRMRLGAKSRKKAESLFSWERHMMEVENYYESLASR